MRRGIIVAALGALLAVAPVASSFAQDKVVKQVERLAKKDGANLNEARGLIKPALEHPETAQKPRAWFVAGLVEEKEVERGYLAMSLGQQVNEKNFYTALDQMIAYYDKAYQLDDATEGRKDKLKKGDRKDMEQAIRTYFPFLVNAGSVYLDEQNFEKAHHYFKKYGEVKKHPIFAGTEIAQEDSMSMQIAFFSAYAASQIPNNLQNAIAEYESIKNTPYRQNDVYQLLAQSYVMAEDTVNFVRTLEEGVQLFPEEQFFLFNMINVYIRQGKHDAAKTYLEEAIKKNPTHKELYFVMATVYEQGFKDSAKAEENFRKALEIDPDYGDAIIGLGRIYYNQAVVIKSEANAITDFAQYEKEDKKANALFEKALPFFERAVELQPDNNEYLMALRGIYYNLKMDDKVAEIEAKMGF